jgi:hypothetical protein
MMILEKLKHEIKAVFLVTLFFAAWLGVLMGVKALILEDYHIRFTGFSMALVGALILGKVVLILEHVPLRVWLRRHPVLVEVLVRTLLYAIGTLVVLLLERSIESRHEHGGILPALANIFKHRDMPHVWANTICLGGALLFYNLFSTLKHELGPGGLARVFLSPPKSDPS